MRTRRVVFDGRKSNRLAMPLPHAPLVASGRVLNDEDKAAAPRRRLGRPSMLLSGAGRRVDSTGRFCQERRARRVGQRGGFPASRSELTPRPFGTHPGLEADSSARCPTSARSSSRKRAQSARSSSETNSPGSSGCPGGFLGCSLGPGDTPHPCVEDVDNSESGEPQTPRRLGPPGGDVGGTLRARAWPETPRRGGMPHEIGAKTANLMHGDGSDKRGPFGGTERSALPSSRLRSTLGQ